MERDALANGEHREYVAPYPKLYVMPNFVGCNMKRVLSNEHNNPSPKQAAKPVSLCDHVRPQSVLIVSLFQ